MGNLRVRYNAKARGSTPGSKKKDKRKDLGGPKTSGQSDLDPNALIFISKSQKDKDEEREMARREYKLNPDTRMNSKKKKRLDKYIDKKLKKEEKTAILNKLAQSQLSSNSVNLQSSSALGSRNTVTNGERFAKLEDMEIRSAIYTNTPVKSSGKKKRKRGQAHVWTATIPSSDDESFAEDVDVTPAIIPAQKAEEIVKITEEWKDEFNEEPEWHGFSFIENDMAVDADPQDDSNESLTNKVDESDVGSASSDSDSDDSNPAKQTKRRKVAGFKEWALTQLHAAQNHASAINTVTGDPIPPPTIAAPIRPRSPGPLRGPLGETLSFPSTSLAQYIRNHANSVGGDPNAISLKKYITVTRDDKIQAARLLLPVVAEEQPIMEAVLLNTIVIICGQTGSGKTTQIPQFLYEAGFGNPGSENPGMIGITQPRRVAAMSMATRVAFELSLSSSRVSYQIRYDATVSPTTAIKFMTDGVLLRELAMDFLLSRYSIIVVDEAHERSMNTDILIGVLSRVVRLREELWKEKKDGIKPLRLIIMSATLRITDFTSNTTLFKTPPPVITISARQHPVTIHFNRRTASDYVTEAIRKSVKIHTRLPSGGILIFLTGQNEITGVCRKLEARFGHAAIRSKKDRREKIPGRSSATPHEAIFEQESTIIVPTQVDVEAEDMDFGCEIEPHDDIALDVDDNHDLQLSADALDSDVEGVDDLDIDDTDTPMHILPLFSLLPSDKQMKVFQEPPPGTRLVVVATNVAETSLTIPGIRYVIDCGRAKERKYDGQSGIQSFQVTWISKASAAQRTGRAGRTGPGHCYRLYSSALFENLFDSFSQPEILRVPIEGVVLQMKSMNIDAVVNFPFPTPPDRSSLKSAETILRHLNALEDTMGDTRITNLGRTLALFPISPRFSRMLASAKQHGCLPYVIAIVSALSVGDPFLHEEALTAADDVKDHQDDMVLLEEIPEFSHIQSSGIREKEAAKACRRAYFLSQQTHSSLGNATSDIFRLLSVVGAYEFAGGGGHSFCQEQFVRPKAMEEIHKLRGQISHIVQANFPDVTPEFRPKIEPPNETQLKVLRQLITAGFIDQVAVRKDLVDTSAANGNKYTSSRNVSYRALGFSEDVFIHPTSVLYHRSPPDYVVYHELVRTSRSWIKTLTVINPSWLPKLGRTLCSISKPIKSTNGKPVVVPRFGPDLWELPPIRQI